MHVANLSNLVQKTSYWKIFIKLYKEVGDEKVYLRKAAKVAAEVVEQCCRLFCRNNKLIRLNNDIVQQS